MEGEVVDLAEPEFLTAFFRLASW